MTAPADLAAALRRAGLAEVDDSTRRRAEYSSDASNYRVVPQVVAFPRHADEVVAAVGGRARAAACRSPRAAAAPRRPATPSAPASCSTSRATSTACWPSTPTPAPPSSSPAPILDSITAAAAPHGLRFGPDPSTHARATIGGSIGNNACGARALRYGRTADNVVALDVLTAAGDRLTAAAATAVAGTRAERGCANA